MPDEHVRRVLDAATRAPTGGNTQPWAFLVLEDADVAFRDRWGRSFLVACVPSDDAVDPLTRKLS